MADKIENNSPQKSKIECNRRYVVSMLKCVEDKVRRSLSDMFADSDLDLYVTKIVEAYRQILLTNACIDGQNVKDLDDLDTSLECEPLDSAKEHYIEHDLMDQFCQQIVKTTQLRKTGPKQAHRKMKCLIRPELKYATVGTVETNSALEEAMDTDEKSAVKNVALDDFTSRLQRVTEKTSNLKPVCDCVLEKSKSLSQACEIYQQSENSDIVKALYETPPNTPVTGSDKKFINPEMEKKVWKKLLLPS